MHCLLELLLVAQSPSAVTSPDSGHVVLVATADVHGRALAWDYVHDVEAPGGLARAAAILGTLRAQYPGQVVVVDAGDLLQGNPFAGFGCEERRRPTPMVDALNALQYDAAAPGNHDFDFGFDFLQDAARDASYIGLTTRTTPTTTRPHNVTGLAFGDLADAVRRVLPAAGATADFVIVLAVVHGIPVVEAGSSGWAIAVVDFACAESLGRQVRARIETPWADAVTPDQDHRERR